MKIRFNRVVKLLTVAAVCSAASGAWAQGAGDWTFEIGIGQIKPKVKSGDVSAPALPGSKADVGSDTEPVFNIGYGLTDNLSVQLDLGMPYTHNIYGAGAIQGTGKLGSVDALPPTALIQYRFFEPTATVRPYVGLGVTYAYFTNAQGSPQLTALTNAGGPPTSFDIDNKVAGTAQVGATLKMNDRWFADLAVLKTKLKTKVHFSSGQQQDMTLDPLTVALTVGFKF